MRGTASICPVFGLYVITSGRMSTESGRRQTESGARTYLQKEHSKKWRPRGLYLPSKWSGWTVRKAPVRNEKITAKSISRQSPRGKYLNAPRPRRMPIAIYLRRQHLEVLSHAKAVALWVADAASKTSGLHKLLHCVGTLERPRWEHARINRFFPRHILWGAHRHYCFHRVESAVARSARVKRPPKIA